MPASSFKSGLIADQFRVNGQAWMKYQIRQMDSALKNPRHEPRNICQHSQPTYFLEDESCRVQYSAVLPKGHNKPQTHMKCVEL